MLDERSPSAPAMRDADTLHRLDALEKRQAFQMTIRRLAAILAADVVGFSSMMERNEEGTLARLKTLQRDLLEPRVSAHHGRVVKTTGDGPSGSLAVAGWASSREHRHRVSSGDSVARWSRFPTPVTNSRQPSSAMRFGSISVSP